MTNKIQGLPIIIYKASEPVEGGQLVEIGSESPMYGVAVTDLAEGESGAVDCGGVFALPKASGAVTQGQALYADGSGGVTTETGGGYVGRAFADAPANASTVAVMLNFGTAPAAE